MLLKMSLNTVKKFLTFCLKKKTQVFQKCVKATKLIQIMMSNTVPVAMKRKLTIRRSKAVRSNCIMIPGDGISTPNVDMSSKRWNSILHHSSKYREFVYE